MLPVTPPHKPGLALPPSPAACPAPASLVDADLLHLGNEHLEQPHDGLQRQLRLPGEDLGEGPGFLGRGQSCPLTQNCRLPKALSFPAHRSKGLARGRAREQGLVF